MKMFGVVCVMMAMTVFSLQGCSDGGGDSTDDSDEDTNSESPGSDDDTDTESETGVPLPEVPRPFEDAGGSFLDNNSNAEWGSEGVCPALEVYCNGSCLSAVGDEQDNCTLLMHKTDETGPIALNSSAVFYLSALREVLKTDLETLETTSVLSGMSFPRMLTVSEDTVFTNSGWPGFEGIVSVGINGENPTIVADYDSDIICMGEGGDRLYFQGSYMDNTFYSISSSGGYPEPVWGDDWAVDMFAASGDYMYYVDYTNQGTALLRAPLPDVNQDAEEMFLAAAYVEDLCVSDTRAYVRMRDSSSDPWSIVSTDLSTGENTQIEISGMKDLIACNDSVAVYRLNGEDTDETSEIYVYSPTDGVSEVIGTMEKDGFGGAVANDTHLFVAVGNMSTGGIIRLALPESLGIIPF
ncbi:MAG: hypothetical protein JXX29_11185 [Deltaproteobacteria bacterium]|nr:hypothetical protein [Deltaproteobacteria bacterium]MBN2672234.1 hypothetical protein [Deltaproteobacteria bacterium]